MPHPSLSLVDRPNTSHVLEEHLDEHAREQDQGDYASDYHHTGGCVKAYP